MQTIKYWQQSPQFQGYPRLPSDIITPFKLYQGDPAFDEQAPNIAKWIVRKLGYPIIDLQLTDQLAYVNIQQSILQFSAIINQQKASQSLFEFIGIKKQLLQNVVMPVYTNKRMIARLSQQIADSVGVGLKTKLYRGSISTVPGKTHYSLDDDWNGKPDDLEGKQIRIKNVYYVQNHDRRRAQFSLFMIPGLINSEASIAYMLWYPQGIMAPLQMLLYKQKRQLVQNVFMASKSYRLYNNQIIITPTPTQQFQIFFEFMVQDPTDFLGDNQNESQSGQPDEIISGFQNIPYSYYKWSYLNQFSKNWIRKYALSSCKQTVGMIRNKFDSLPSPQRDISLDGSELINNAITQKQNLRNQLRQKLQTLKQTQRLTDKRQQAENLNQLHKYRPLEVTMG